MKRIMRQVLDSVTRINKWVTVFATVCMALMMVMIVIDIVASKWFNWSFPGMLDFSEELMVLLTLLPIAYIVLERGHIRITLVEERTPPAGRFIMYLLRYLVGAAIMGFISWRTFAQLQFSLATSQVKAGIAFPTWPANVAVVLSFALLSLVYLLLLVKTLSDGIGTSQEKA